MGWGRSREKVVQFQEVDLGTAESAKSYPPSQILWSGFMWIFISNFTSTYPSRPLHAMGGGLPRETFWAAPAPRMLTWLHQQ